MAVLGRVLFSSSQRIDLPDLLSIDSYAAGDWKYFLQSVVGASRPYILNGFEVINPQGAIGSPSCSIKVADSVIYYPGSSAGPFFYGLPEGDPASAPLVPQLRANATNYVYLTLTTFNTASDTRALWDPDRNGGVGAEFSQDVNTESVIQAQVNVSTGSFPINTVPVAIITMGPNAITSIQDARDMLFRLGTGGLNPNPLNTFAFRNLPGPQYARSEPSTVISSSTDPNPFQGGDKNITTLKEWMDLVMTKLKEIGGTRYWYEDTETFSLVNIFKDALTGSWKSKGQYTHSSSVPGQLSWSEDIHFKSAASPRDLVIRASNANPLLLENEQVAFIKLIRDEQINSLDSPVAFVKGQSYINTIGGLVGLFQNLKKGDWIKKASDDDAKFLQVMEFYGELNATGAVVPPANARSIKLSGPYAGSTSQPNGDRARFDRGEYSSANNDILVVDRFDPIVTAAGANLFWFALRSDTILEVASVTSYTIAGEVTSVSAEQSTVTSADHGLKSGDRITVTSPEELKGTYSVEVETKDTFIAPLDAQVGDNITAHFAILETASRSTPYGYLLESANHGLDSGETVIISGTNSYDGSVVANVRSPTEFQFAIGADLADETPASALVTVPRIDARSEEGINKLLQGTTVDVGGSSATDNIRAFIGMTAPDQLTPVYSVPPGYNTLAGGANYNGSITDNLTARTSKNTAMLMNKAQDKTVQFVTNAVAAINQAAPGAVQQLLLSPDNSELVIVQPGSPGNASVQLSGIGLGINQCAFVEIDRNLATTPGVQIANINEVPVAENVFVLATRLTDSTIYLWDGQAVVTSIPLATPDPVLIPITLYDPVSTSRVTGPNVIIDGVLVRAGDTVLFSNLANGNNVVYRAVGVGSNISGWDATSSFSGKTTPILGHTVLVKKGITFALQIGKYDGTQWDFNSKVRCFNGEDYFEQSSVVSAKLAAATTETLFAVDWKGSEHMLIDYSIVQAVSRETGTMRVVTDGVRATVSTDSSYVNGNTGVSFNAQISGDKLILQYSNAAVQDGAMKYMIRRWSSDKGGPAGVPIYSGAASPPTAAGGPVDSIQFNSGGAVTGVESVKIDLEELSINLNGLHYGSLSSKIPIATNASWTNLFLVSGDDDGFKVMEYSAVFPTVPAARMGQVLVANYGTDLSFTETHTETQPTNFAIRAIKVGNDTQFQYMSSHSGHLRYSWRKWNHT